MKKMNKIDFKNVMLVAIFVILIFGFGLILNKMGKKDDENYKECIKHYSKNYCVKTIYGVY